MPYYIHYSYNIGDSFNHYPNQEGKIELTWTNFEIAKENLKNMKEHYEFCKKDYRNMSNKAIKKYEKQMFKKSWCPEKYYNVTMNFKLDNGNFCQLSVLYIDYFSSLNWAEIRAELEYDKNYTMRIEFI